MIRGNVKSSILRYCVEPKAFGEIQRESAIAQSSLAKFLGELVEEGFVSKQSDGHYKVTEKGIEEMNDFKIIERAKELVVLRRLAGFFYEVWRWFAEAPKFQLSAKEDQELSDRIAVLYDLIQARDQSFDWKEFHRRMGPKVTFGQIFKGVVLPSSRWAKGRRLKEEILPIMYDYVKSIHGGSVKDVVLDDLVFLEGLLNRMQKSHVQAPI